MQPGAWAAACLTLLNLILGRRRDPPPPPRASGPEDDGWQEWNDFARP